MNEEKYCRSCEEPVVERIPGCPLQCGSEKCSSYKKIRKIDFSKKPIVWVLGGPGSGKGTQCAMIVKKYGYTHLSTGDLLREEIARGAERAKCLRTVMERGGLVPTDIVLSILLEAMTARAEKSKGFLIDGYPREAHQGEAFEKAIAPPSAIIYLEANRETMIERLKRRGVKSGRFDDNEEVISARLETFYANNDKVLAQYPGMITTINGDQSAEGVFETVQNVLDPLHA